MSLGPKPYAVVYDTNLGLQYVFESGTVPFVAAQVASALASAVANNFGPVTLYTVPADGMYRISYYIVNTVSGAGADAVGQLVYNYTDPSGANALYANMPSGINATLLGNGEAPVYLTAGSTVTYTLGSGVFAGGLRMLIATTIEKA